jgi:ribosomal-protein-alanine N-acetyltransferase
MALSKFHPNDLDQIVSIEQATFGRTAFSRRTFLRFHRDRNTIFLVWKEEEQVAGYVIGSVCGESSSLYVASLAVCSDQRRRGIATRLMQSLLSAGREAGTELLWLHVRMSNARAIDFYESLSFQITREVPGYYPEEDAYIMMRPLPPAETQSES